jgi:hypothetical protein
MDFPTTFSRDRFGHALMRSTALGLALAGCLAGSSLALATDARAAPPIDYSSFASTAGLSLNGEAAQNGTALRLTPAEQQKSGTAFSDTEIQTTASFETEFELLMHESNTADGIGVADGMGFVLQPGSAASVGAPGGDLGFAGITPSADVAYDIFDDYFYSPPDPPVPYVAFMKDGNVLEHLATSEAPLKDLSLYGAPVWSWVDYDAATHVLSVYGASTDTKPATPLFTYTVNLAEVLGSEYTFAGFTAGTGSGDAAQEVLGWQLTTSGQLKTEQPVVPPPPGKPAEQTHGSATQVICNLIVATASDTCTATVSDVDIPAAISPTGQVAFTSANGGVFSAGSTCNLVATLGSANTASCSVQFLPPSDADAGPAITASYSGDAHHVASKGQTFYPPASELAKEVDISEIGNVKEGGTVDTSLHCGFPCEATGELMSGSGGEGGAAGAARVGESLTFIAGAAKKGAKHKVAKPVVLGKGTLKLTAPGSGQLVVKLSAKGRKALAHLGRKGVRATLVVTIRTLTGTVVATDRKQITLRPAPKARKRHGKKGKSHGR